MRSLELDHVNLLTYDFLMAIRSLYSVSYNSYSFVILNHYDIDYLIYLPRFKQKSFRMLLKMNISVRLIIASIHFIQYMIRQNLPI